MFLMVSNRKNDSIVVRDGDSNILRIICPGYGGKKRKGVNNELEIDENGLMEMDYENGYFDVAHCRC
jgi:hypothetical protein